MTKLETVLGTLLLGSLIACSGSKDDAPADAQQPAAATTPATNTDETKPAGESTTAQNPAPTTPATTNPTVPTDPPTTPAPVADTCESLAAKASTPAGKLTDVASIKGMYPIDPVDVYATEDEKALHIVLTETANACAYHANNFQTEQMNELTIEFPKTATDFAPGTFKPSGFSQESGMACSAKPPSSEGGSVGSVGTAFGGGSARGKVTITAKTASLVEGTVDIASYDGGKTTFTFSAPICPVFAVNKDTACCASAQP